MAGLILQCLCGASYENFDDFWAHRREAHGDRTTEQDDYGSLAVPERKTATPCIRCGTYYGSVARNSTTPWRSREGRCRRCFDEYKLLQERYHPKPRMPRPPKPTRRY